MGRRERQKGRRAVAGGAALPDGQVRVGDGGGVQVIGQPGKARAHLLGRPRRDEKPNIVRALVQLQHQQCLLRHDATHYQVMAPAIEQRMRAAR